MQVRAQLDDPQILSGAPLGTRRILYVTRGSFSGSGFEGEVLPGGGDWVLLRRDGVAELDIRFTLRTEDAQLIYVRSGGIFHVSPRVSERIRNGEDVPLRILLSHLPGVRNRFGKIQPPQSSGRRRGRPAYHDRHGDRHI